MTTLAALLSLVSAALALALVGALGTIRKQREEIERGKTDNLFRWEERR